jgi:hypothetical protein
MPLLQQCKVQLVGMAYIFAKDMLVHIVIFKWCLGAFIENQMLSLLYGTTIALFVDMI